MGNNAIGKIAIGFECHKSSFRSQPVYFHVVCGKQCADGSGRIGWLETIDSQQHPDKFA